MPEIHWGVADKGFNALVDCYRKCANGSGFDGHFWHGDNTSDLIDVVLQAAGQDALNAARMVAKADEVIPGS